MKLIGIFLVGVVAAAMTFVCTFVVGVFVPGTAVTVSGTVDKEKIREGRFYTREELEKAEREMERRIAEVDKELANMTGQERLILIRKGYWWITWFPWLLLAFLLRIKLPTFEVVALFAPLVITVVMGWLLPIETALSAGAFLLGTGIRLLLRRNRST